MDYREIYKNELANKDTRYFILDTYSYNAIDVDFEKYSWEINKYNKVRPKDLFIYRRPGGEKSETGDFYYFGSGKISNIIGENEVYAEITSGLLFGKYLTRTDLETFEWTFKKRGDNWLNFTHQYGMTQITKEDFVGLLNLQNTLSIVEAKYGIIEQDYDYTNIEKEIYQQQQQEEYYVPDQEGYTKTRGAAQAVFAQAVKLNYRYKCCITGISTSDFLVASHIVPWSKDANNRINLKNGLCLSSLLDKAFDKRYISFDDNFKIIVSEKIVGDDVLKKYLYKYDGCRINTYGGKLPDLEFIRWHRNNVFKK
ncbi:MAG: HNH endonuclease [Acholeplasmataceae bacterium]|jgi:putative restriction endonuclease